MPPTPLAQSRLSQKIRVLAEQRPPEFLRPIKQLSIRQLCRAIDVRREHINPTKEQTTRDCRRDVHLHVQADAHVSLPNSRRRLRIGDSPVSARPVLACCRVFWMSAEWLSASWNQRDPAALLSIACVGSEDDCSLLHSAPNSRPWISRAAFGAAKGSRHGALLPGSGKRPNWRDSVSIRVPGFY